MGSQLFNNFEVTVHWHEGSIAGLNGEPLIDGKDVNFKGEEAYKTLLALRNADVRRFNEFEFGYDKCKVTFKINGNYECIERVDMSDLSLATMDTPMKSLRKLLRDASGMEQLERDEAVFLNQHSEYQKTLDDLQADLKVYVVSKAAYQQDKYKYPGLIHYEVKDLREFVYQRENDNSFFTLKDQDADILLHTTHERMVGYVPGRDMLLASSNAYLEGDPRLGIYVYPVLKEAETAKIDEFAERFSVSITDQRFKGTKTYEGIEGLYELKEMLKMDNEQYRENVSCNKGGANYDIRIAYDCGTELLHYEVSGRYGNLEMAHHGKEIYQLLKANHDFMKPFVDVHNKYADDCGGQEIGKMSAWFFEDFLEEQPFSVDKSLSVEESLEKYQEKNEKPVRKEFYEFGGYRNAMYTYYDDLACIKTADQLVAPTYEEHFKEMALIMAQDGITKTTMKKVICDMDMYPGLSEYPAKSAVAQKQGEAILNSPEIKKAMATYKKNKSAVR